MSSFKASCRLTERPGMPRWMGSSTHQLAALGHGHHPPAISLPSDTYQLQQFQVAELTRIALCRTTFP